VNAVSNRHSLPGKDQSQARDEGHVFFVGSVARPSDGWDVEDVLTRCSAALDGHVSMLPDGEVGDRHHWISYVKRHAYAHHPDMITLTRHTYDDWIPKGRGDQWFFSLRPGITEIDFESLGYAREAKASYAIFRRLRDEGVLGARTRFQVALPMIESATRSVVDSTHNFELLYHGYGRVMEKEIAAIVDAIPAADLAIQWDMVAEVAAAENAPYSGGVDPRELETLPPDPFERLAVGLRWMCAGIPDEALLGLHVCYGSMSQRPGESSDAGHFMSIRDLSTSVQVVKAAARALDRPIDYAHMAVQATNGFDESYYAPLAWLDPGEIHVYLGLVHLHDGVEGALRRIEIARRYHHNFGIATQCGWGRRPPEESVEALLELERAVADRAF
jgi:hypothetical protein